MKTRSVRKQVTVCLMWDKQAELYHARIPDFPEVITSGETEQDALANAKEALELHLECADEDPDDVGDTGPVTLGQIEVVVPLRQRSTV